MEGWIKLHRKLLQSLIFGNEKGLKVWLWCLLKANHSPNTFLLGRQKVALLAGQFIMGSNTAIDELKLAKATLWYWLHFLEEQGQVVLQKNAKYTVVTLLNWSEYQTQLDAGETLERRWVGTNKNEENVKNEKNTCVATAPQFEIVQGKEEDTERPKKETRRKDKEAVYKLFSSKEQPWWRHAQQKQAALALFDLVGVDSVRHGVTIMDEHSDDKFCPQAATPFEYEEKREALKRYIKRNGL